MATFPSWKRLASLQHLNSSFARTCKQLWTQISLVISNNRRNGRRLFGSGHSHCLSTTFVHILNNKSKAFLKFGMPSSLITKSSVNGNRMLATETKNLPPILPNLKSFKTSLVFHTIKMRKANYKI